MENKLIKKYLFCEKRLKEFKETEWKKDSKHMYDYGLKYPKECFSYIYSYIFSFLILGMIGTLFFKFALDLSLGIVATSFLFGIYFVLSYSLIVLIRSKTKVKRESIVKKLSLKNTGKNKVKEEKLNNKDEEASRLLILTLSSLFPVAIVCIITMIYILTLYSNDYDEYKKDKKKYFKTIYLKRYFNADKMQEKLKYYKEEIENSQDAVIYLYENKDKKELKSLYKEVIEKIKKEKLELDAINMKFNTKKEHNIKIKTF